MSKKSLPILLITVGSVLLLTTMLFINIENVEDIQSKLFNRIGILLSLAGGFLVAPDLIGLDRIKKIEDSLKNNYLFIFHKIRNAQKNIFNSPAIPFFFFLGTAIGVFIAIVIFIEKKTVLMIITNPSMIPPHLKGIFIFSIVFVVIVTILIIAALIYGLVSEDGDRKPRFHVIPTNPLVIIQILVLMAVTLSVALLVLLPVLIILGFFYFLLGLLNKMVTLLRKKLESNESLSKILIRIGIVVIILGAIFQLAATL